MAKASVKGGARSRSFLSQAKAKAARTPPRVAVGFFKTARYNDGTLVAAVAAKNEFGYGNVPERPFFRIAIGKARHGLRRIARSQARSGFIPSKGLEMLGMHMQAAVQTSIVTLDTPPNNPQTIERKGSSNPLIDSGKMKNSVTYRIER